MLRGFEGFSVPKTPKNPTSLRTLCKEIIVRNPKRKGRFLTVQVEHRNSSLGFRGFKGSTMLEEFLKAL